MCGIAHQHEIGETDIKLYPSVKSFKKWSRCAEGGCGIVKVTVTDNGDWVEPTDHALMYATSIPASALTQHQIKSTLADLKDKIGFLTRLMEEQKNEKEETN